MTHTAESDAEPTDAQRARVYAVAGAVLAAALVASAFYMLDRSWAFLQNGPPNPLSMTTSARIDYFWRMALSAFIGATCGALWWRASAGREVRAFGWLMRGLLPVILICSALAGIFP